MARERGRESVRARDSARDRERVRETERVREIESGWGLRGGVQCGGDALACRAKVKARFRPVFGG